MKLLACLTILIIFSYSMIANVPIFTPRIAEIEHVLTIEAPTDACNTVQGATFDGEYFYVAFVDKSDEYETAIIVKTDKDGVEIARSEELAIDHANSITILANGNMMVAHCHSPDEHYNTFSVLDSDSLELLVTAELDNPFMSIAYCDAKDQYVSGEWDGKKINIYDEDLVYSHSFEVEYAEFSTPQSYYCTDKAIYTVRFIFDDGFTNYIYAYSHDGDLLLEYEIDLSMVLEAEAISVADDYVYVICGANEKCEIFKIDHLIM